MLVLVPTVAKSGKRRPKAARFPCREIQTTIGQGLKEYYEPPQELSHRLFALLIQMNEKSEQE
jgi:hypothetical protein